MCGCKCFGRCCPSEAEREQKKIDEMIQKIIDENERQKKREIKILLLGTAESGKSTFIKQMRILHGPGFTDNERREFISVIHANIFGAIHNLIAAMQNLQINYFDTKNYSNAYFLEEHSLTMNQSIAEMVKSLWNDSGIQECYLRRREFQLIDSAKYFLDDIDRIGASDYLPTQQDVLRSRQATSGSIEYKFEDKPRIYRIIDVGGQRGERRLWLHFFDQCNALIFLVAISEYDQRLVEADANRMVESKCLFHSTIAQPWFENSAIILFLNKVDILAEKIKLSDVAEYFPGYTGPKQDFDDAKHFFLDMYTKPVTDRRVYSHFTCATDTENIQIVFAVVKDMILKILLRETGFA